MKKRKWEVNLMLQAAAKTKKHEQGQSRVSADCAVWKCGRRVGIRCDENFLHVAQAWRPYMIHVLSIFY
jgi:hypothetical protein